MADVYQYGDRDAALLMKEAKHDPETEGAVHAARRYGPIDISTQQWGKPGTYAEKRIAVRDIPPGQASTLRGETFFPRDQPPDVNVYPGADAEATLAHELGHVIMRGQDDEPPDPYQREAAADLFARQGDLKQHLEDPNERQQVRAIVVQGLGKDIRRGNEVDLSQRPSALDRLNTQLEQERAPVRDVPKGIVRYHPPPLRTLKRGGSR
jgi:hypothetical protein